MPVEFRFIDGACIPLHKQGGCSGAHNHALDGGIVRSPESRCYLTKCQKCGDPVFFIRYNGGSVFIDPPLGPPWRRHPCMPERPRVDRPAVAPPPWNVLEAQKLLGKVRGTVTGVVIEAEVSRGRKQTILTMAVADETTLVLLVRGGADYFLGKIVVLRPAIQRLYSIENVAEVFVVEKALQVPASLQKSEFKLLSDGGRVALPPKDTVGDDSLDPALPKAAQKALRKYRANKFEGSWKPAELVCLVSLLKGREQDIAIHHAALAILNHGSVYGDYGLLVALAQTLFGTKRQQLVSWLRNYTPVIIEVRRKDKKMLFRRDEAGKIEGFDPAQLRNNPFYSHPIAKD